MDPEPESMMLGKPVGDSPPHTRSMLAIAIVVLAVGAPMLLLSPVWYGNDDIAMSMAAHGYGLAAHGTPEIVFANVLYGHLVRALPVFGGVPGYATAMMGLLALSAFGATLAMLRTTINLAPAFCIIALVFLLPTLFPQFTFTAGLLTAAAALLALSTDVRPLNICGWLLVVILAFMGWLVRSHEFMLVAGVAAVMTPWRKLFRSRIAMGSMAILVILIAASTWLDQDVYQTLEWRRFGEFNEARAPFTDFRATQAIAQSPEVMQRFNLSDNDLLLLKRFFFSEGVTFDSSRLDEILGFLDIKSNTFNTIMLSDLARAGVAFLDPELLPLTVFIVMVSWPLRTRGLVAGWLAFGLALAAFAVMGRPGVLRVYYPVVVFLMIAALLAPREQSLSIRKRVWASAVAALCIALALHVPRSLSAAEKWRTHQQEFTQLPDETLFVWGDAMPLTDVRPVFDAQTLTRDRRYYALGVFTKAPFSTAYAEQRKGSLDDRLTSSEGALIFLEDTLLGLVKQYCAEHHDATMNSEIVAVVADLKLRLIHCISERGSP